MITYKIWDDLMSLWFPEVIDVFLTLLLSIITIPLDLLLLPIELIAFIIYKVRKMDK